MDRKTKNLIIKILRQGSLRHSARDHAKRKFRVAPATYKCNVCECYIYTGKKDLDQVDFEQYDVYNVDKGKIHMDHIIPVINPSKHFTNWDDYINSLFCSEDNFQALCESCHKEKTKKENSKRRKKNVSKKNT